MSKEYYERRAMEIVESKKPQDEPKAVEPQASQALPKVIQLPLWPEPQRAAPNVVVRSAIFGMLSRGKEREYCKNEVLAAWGTNRIRFSGLRLDQYDADIWFQALHYAQIQQSPSVTFTARSFLRALGRTQSGQDAARLDASITRMVATALTVTDGKQTYVGSLVQEYTKHETTGRYRLVLNPHLTKLFSCGYTRFDWQLRQGLKTDLAKWLNTFVLSHRASESAPQYVAIKDLYAMTNAKTALKDFRWNVKKAMAQLLELRVISSWRLTENDALGFTRQSAHQRRLEDKNNH